MKLSAFDYYAPDTLDEALVLLAEHGDEAKPLAAHGLYIGAIVLGNENYHNCKWKNGQVPSEIGGAFHEPPSRHRNTPHPPNQRRDTHHSPEHSVHRAVE